jgi:hypothetical protein
MRRDLISETYMMWKPKNSKRLKSQNRLTPLENLDDDDDDDDDDDVGIIMT